MAQAEMRYLLAVYQLCEDGSEVRSVDVAGFLDISRASVAKQMKLLLQKGLIEKQRYGGIRLSAEGARQAALPRISDAGAGRQRPLREAGCDHLRMRMVAGKH